jgi:hypothetical protein
VKRNQALSIDAMGALEALVAELNRIKGAELAATAIELRDLVKAWHESGPNLLALHAANPGLWIETQKAFRPSIIPTKSGYANLHLLHNAGAPGVMESLGKAGVRFYAVVWFNALTLNPLWSKLAGPCARCGNYYIKKRASQKVYCSRRCGNAATAVARTRQRIANERKDKLSRAKASLREWRTANTQEDWKSWVAKQTDIDSRFLTRAFKKDELKPPTKGR